jgi:hypothetical protein
MALLFQRLPQLTEIIDLPIKDNADCTILIPYRLGPPGEIDNTEAAHA